MFFVLITVVAYWLLVPRKARPLFLALVSFGYIFLYQPEGMLFLALLSVLIYFGTRVLTCLARPFGLFLLLVVFLVGVLGYFKYSAFLVENLNYILGFLGQERFRVPQVVAPLGVSYFTFKMLHYVIDAYRGKLAPHAAGDFLAYIFFYPILVSGPIERFQPFYAQLINNVKWDYFYEGLPRILIGLFKKIVLADSLALTAALLHQQDLSAWQYWLASFSYTLQLYFDFSGYSDMAIGIARLFGIKVMENFNWPYLAKDPSDFWKRWHMSLTGWFRDYVFIPLGGSRGSLSTTIRNTLIVMAITGLWHGAQWHFVFWGMYHALGLIAVRLYRRFLLPGLLRWVPGLDSKLSYGLSVLLTFNFVNIGWIFFACDARQSLYVLSRMFG